MITWTPTTQLVSGETYQLPNAGVSVPVSVNGVSFIGGQVWPVQGSAFRIKPGVKGTRFNAVNFVFPNAPTDGKKIKVNNSEIGACIYDEGRDTRIYDCGVGAVNQFYEAQVTQQGAIITELHATADLRGALVYLNGSGAVTVEDSTSFGSRQENIIRASPFNNHIPSELTVRRCTLIAIINKAAINPRQCTGFLIEYCTLTALQNNSCIGVGNEFPMGRDDGASDGVIRGNTLNTGLLSLHAGAHDIDVLRNTINTTDQDVGITLNGKPGILRNVTLRGNLGIRNAQSQKPFVAYINKENIPGLIDDGTNQWKL